MTKTLSERIAALKESLSQDLVRIETGSEEANKQVISWDKGFKQASEICIQIIKELQAENQALLAKVKELEGNGWLPIESAEIGKWVLVATAKIVMKAFVDAKANCGTDLIIIGDDGREYQDFVTHFMPLPKPPTKTKGE